MNMTLTVFRRLSMYLYYLKQLPKGVTRISATTIAHELGMGEVLVRKELSYASGAVGRPKTGYVVSTLICALENFLGYNTLYRAIVVGAGELGHALMKQEGFSDFGLYIAAGFDTNQAVIGTQAAGRPILSLDDLERFCAQQPVELGIITVPKQAAQEVCDRLVNCGIRSIWNFAPIPLKVPEDVKVHYENLSASLALLTNHLRETEKSAI